VYTGTNRKMTALQLPANFTTSYKDFESYPSNLICQTSYLYAIRASKERLDATAHKLFTTNDGEVEVPTRDSLPMPNCVFQADSRAFQKKNILNDDKLRGWLGDTSSINQQTGTPEGSLATQEDPKCRFM
jgi:hypothetical protein